MNEREAGAGCANQACGQQQSASVMGLMGVGVHRQPTISVLVNIPSNHGFSAALQALKGGARVTRRGWNGQGMWLELQLPDKGSKMSRPYIFMKTVDNELVPWVASQSDLLAEDWAVYPQ